MNTAITATGWNGTPLIYNVEKDRWELSDDTDITFDHIASELDMEAARDACEREGGTFGDTIQLTSIENDIPA